ncbi:histone-lysine N-methyltransferase SETDB1-B-like isoform X1 [Poecilia reticulata]|uniref:histone-lysine N-methyltransferase SETDB1-B-like isoform X1 n=1 Tax=Poecilia reticulata TaxID=8081 RepID=UPI0004A220D9|nr:PREDICTED: histone-lysine N-methyltransferase SETDB1-B-like isoform X1 [Poecilia reticulata]XP_008427640.1 PREDICTED: histone-lysine N-methyltransferase SETDB1-B-like isoform X1 [Poecilia reticulata]
MIIFRTRKKVQMDDLNDENLQKKPVVVLTRLPEFTLNALQPPTPQQFDSEAESRGSSDSDMLWEPGDDSGDSDFGAKKKTQLKHNNSKHKKANEVTVPSPLVSINNNSTSNSSVCNNDSNTTIKAALVSPVIVSAAFASHSNETRNVRPDLPEAEITLDMVVLARRRVTRWQRGKIVEIIKKDDGRVKYKIIFDEKGKSLVSGHHIAKETTPKLDQLYVGARVLIQSPEDEQCFLPGLLSELPSRKNRLRFLVFLDDHTPVYVSLPSLYLVCRQMDDPLGDLAESPHKCFMTQYLRSWPYPHLTHYKEGQILKIELNGVYQKCQVELVDCSLMKVVFEENGETDWIHRGSLRLEHMSKFLELKQNRGSKADDSDSK